MYALISKTPGDAHCIAVSGDRDTLERTLKAEAKSFLDERFTEEEQEELGYTNTLAKATTRWSDEDDEYPYELYIEETYWI